MGVGVGMITIEIKCPKCGKLKKPEQLREITNEFCDVDVITGHALITICCKVIVFKDHWFDYNRGLFAEGEKKLVKKGYKMVEGVAIPPRPEVFKRRKVHQFLTEE